MKDCFTPHAVMHNLMGLGIGFVLVSFWPTLGSLWLGLGIVAVAMVLDFMRK